MGPRWVNTLNVIETRLDWKSSWMYRPKKITRFLEQLDWGRHSSKFLFSRLKRRELGLVRVRKVRNQTHVQFWDIV